MAEKNFYAKILKFSLVLIIFLALVFLNPRNFFSPLRSVFLGAAYPFQKTFYFLSEKSSNIFSLFSSISNLKNENGRLMRENISLSARLAQLEGQKKENEELRKELELIPRQNFNLEAMTVIAQDSNGLGSWIMVDKGKKFGIETGMPVIIYDGILVGKVSEVYLSSSKIALLTDSSSYINAVDLATGAKGILVGEYGLGIALNMVAQTEVLNEGDDIVTSGLGETIPKGFLIGKVEQIKSSSDKLFQQAIISPKVKYSDLDTVFAVKSSL